MNHNYVYIIWMYIYVCINYLYALFYLFISYIVIYRGFYDITWLSGWDDRQHCHGFGQRCGYAVYAGTGGEPVLWGSVTLCYTATRNSLIESDAKIVWRDLRAPGGTLEHQNASEIGAPWCLMHYYCVILAKSLWMMWMWMSSLIFLARS